MPRKMEIKGIIYLRFFKNGNVLKLIRNVSSCLLSMKKTGMLIVLFFSTFLCSYTFLLGKKKLHQKAHSAKCPHEGHSLPEAGGTPPGADDFSVPLFWGLLPPSQDLCALLTRQGWSMYVRLVIRKKMQRGVSGNIGWRR